MALPLLSNEQMRAVKHGVTGEPDRYEWVDLPAGKQPLPAWLTGSRVCWNGYYSNSPMLSLKGWRYDDQRLAQPEHKMPGWYRQEMPGLFVDRHPDGRVHHLTHSSPVVWCTLSRHSHYEKDAAGRTLFSRSVQVDYQAWATREKSCGFGGDTYRVRELVASDLGSCEHDHDRGWWRWVELRGPWHSSPPADCEECASSIGGLTITKDLLVKIFATYHPWHRLALVTSSGVTTLDPVHKDWPAPKQFLPQDHPVWATTGNQYVGSTT